MFAVFSEFWYMPARCLAHAWPSQHMSEMLFSFSGFLLYAGAATGMPHLGPVISFFLREKRKREGSPNKIQIDSQINSQIDVQIDTQTESQIDSQIGIQNNSRIDSQVDSQIAPKARQKSTMLHNTLHNNILENIYRGGHLFLNILVV